MVIATTDWTACVTLIAPGVTLLATVVIAWATVVIARATKHYTQLVWEQLGLREPRVFPCIASENHRPFVDVTNTGAATAYKVSVTTTWPKPPDEVDGEQVEDPPFKFGKLLPQETIRFKSPHDFDLQEYFKGPATDSSEYRVSVSVKYVGPGEKTYEPEPTVLDFGDYYRTTRQCRVRRPPSTNR